MSAEESTHIDKRDRNLALVCLITLTVGIAISILKYGLYYDVKITWDLLHVHHTAFSIALLIAMAGLYYHASRFYKDSFYLFLSIGWLINLAYLLFLQGAPSELHPEYLNAQSFAMLIALVTDLPFYLAARTRPARQANYKDLVVPFGAIALWFAVRLYPIDPLARSQLHVVIAIAFATYVGFKVFGSFRLRTFKASLENTDSPELPPALDSSSRFPRLLLSYDFLALATIQLTFVLVLFEDTRFLVNYLLYAALGLKIINAYALTLMLREDYADIRSEAERNKERLLQERQERSEFEEIGLLTASIEHELRTPLGVIKSILNEMSRKYQNVNSIDAAVEELQIQRERLLNATKIIRVLRGGHEFFNKRLTTVNLTHLARKSVRDLRKELDIDDVIFKYDERFGQPFAKAHSQLLEQAIINILKNAVESIRGNHKSGGEVIVIISKSKFYDDSLEMLFKDNGEGFPEGSVEKLTQPDFSTKAAERPNSGLGLFVCERIIKLHNGSLEFRPSDGGGAIVAITLPRAVIKKDRKSGNDGANDQESLE